MVSQCSLCNWLFSLFSRHISRTQSFQQNRHVIFPALVALNLLVSLISRIVACSARTVADKQTDRQTDRPTHRRTTVTLAAHAPRVNNVDCDSSVVTDEPPNLPELLRMKEQQEVGNNYFDFGILLLEDRTGNRVDAIEDKCRRNPDRITRKILQDWVSGKGAALTWQTLVKTLRDCKLNILADHVQATKLPPAP